MPSNPTTKSQVHAYKFVLRRMQSALVRKDAVMLHDPMRTHSRATIVGIVLSAIAVIGVIIFGFFSPAPKPPGPGTIVIGEQSGQIYVMTSKPAVLIPTFNLASARLILMAQQQKGSGPSAAAGGGGSAEVVKPEVVPDEQLVDIPRGAPTGIRAGPPLMPGKNLRISPHWAVCDRIEIDPDQPRKRGRELSQISTTVVAGVPDLGRELRNDEALLVQAPGQDETYLVYRLNETPNHPNANVVRAPVDLTDEAVVSAYGLNKQPRKVSEEMLSAIPEVAAIEPPEIQGSGQSEANMGIGIGEVFAVQRAAGGLQHWVVTEHGIQKVSEAVADLIRSDQTGRARVPVMQPDVIAGVEKIEEGEQGYLPVGSFPKTEPTILNPRQVPVSCLGWHTTGEGDNRKGLTTLYVNRAPVVPEDKAGKSEGVEVTQASPAGYQVDQFYMPPGRAAVVRSVTSKEQFGKGPIQLVSSQGIRYGVPRVRTAQALGLTPQDPAPELILRLLPTGPSLTVQAALREWSPDDVDLGESKPVDQGKR